MTPQAFASYRLNIQTTSINFVNSRYPKVREAPFRRFPGPIDAFQEFDLQVITSPEGVWSLMKFADPMRMFSVTRM